MLSFLHVMNNNITIKSHDFFLLRFTVDCYLMDCPFYLDSSNSDDSTKKISFSLS